MYLVCRLLLEKKKKKKKQKTTHRNISLTSLSLIYCIHSFLFLVFFYSYSAHLDLHSFPTRRSSDLFICPLGTTRVRVRKSGMPGGIISERTRIKLTGSPGSLMIPPGIRSEEHRLNSSHRCISYAVFCLKKKKKKKNKKLHTEIYHLHLSL